VKCIPCIIELSYFFIVRPHCNSIYQFVGDTLSIAVKPVCMTFEDYYAAFSADSHPAFSVQPAVGRMDRRGGEESILDVVCTPNGVGGDLTGDLVINLPEDNSKICYKITAHSL
jgi:hypothetical protein